MADQANTLVASADGGEKFTQWAKEPTLRELKLDWEAAKPAHDGQMLKINRWNDVLNVTGGSKIPKRRGRSSVQPRLVRRQAEWRYSPLSEPFLGTDHLFKFTPATFEDGPSAKQNMLLLNHQFRNQLDRVPLIDNFVRCTVDEGTSILQTGWIRHVIQVKEDVPVYDHMQIEDEEALNVFKQALQLRKENPRGYKEQCPPEVQAAVDYYDESGEATVAVDTGRTEKVVVDKILENRPTVTVRNPKNVVIDPSCDGDFEKAQFVGVTFETTKAELLKEGKRYKNLDKVLWDSNGPLNEPDHATSTPNEFALKDQMRRKVVAFEYWGYHDIHDDGILLPIVATWIGQVLVRLEESPFPDDKLPFVVCTYLPVKREVYGEPDAELLEDNQRILGAVSRGLVDLLGRSANGQQGIAKGMLDPLNRRRFDSGEDYEFNPNVSPANGYVQHKYPEIPQSALVLMQTQNQEAEALTGVKSFAGGLSGESYGDVAAGVRGALDAASKREMSILRRFANAWIKVAKKIAAMNAVFLSEEETVRITNDEFVVIRREDLKGNFDIKVDISTAEVDNAQAQDLAFMLQTCGPNEDPAMRRMLLAEIADLKRMPELAQRIRSYQPQPDPMQVKMQELEMAKLEAEIAEIKSRHDLNLSKAEELGAKTDKANLDYVEQETGTAHLRDVEKIRSQATGNIDLEVTKALTRPIKENEKRGNIEAGIGYGQIARKSDDAPDDSAILPKPGMLPADPSLAGSTPGMGVPDPSVM